MQCPLRALVHGTWIAEINVLQEKCERRVFIAGSLVWGIVADGFRPDRWDIAGTTGCLLGVAVIMYPPLRSPKGHFSS